MGSRLSGKGFMAIAMLAVMVMFASALPLSAAGPNNLTWVKSGWKDGPVELPATLGEVASLPLPRGSYAVSAKLWLWNDTGQVRLSNCKLSLGNSWDWVEEETPGLEHEAISLQVAGRLRGPGKAVLECFDQGAGEVTAHWIKITAIKASRLRNVPLD